MDKQLKPLSEIVALNTDLLLNCLAGLSETDAVVRPMKGINSISFLAVHIIDARFFMAKMLRRPLKNPLQATLADVQTIDEVGSLPPLDELKAYWRTVSRQVMTALEEVKGDLLKEKAPSPFPVADESILGGLFFLVQHESYHIGQMAILRKGLGFNAMSYERME